MDFILDVDHKSITLYESMKIQSFRQRGSVPKAARDVILAGGSMKRHCLYVVTATEYIHTTDP